MDAATLSMILSAVAGPASGVVVALLCILMFGYFLVKHLLPQQQAMIDDFVKESRASRKIFVDAVEIMSRRLDKVEDGLENVEDGVKEIKVILRERS
jgi:hypothetical protein